MVPMGVAAGAPGAPGALHGAHLLVEHMQYSSSSTFLRYMQRASLGLWGDMGAM